MNCAAGESDGALMVRAAEGDRASYEIVVRRYKETLFRFARRYLGNDEDAYDVLQEAFLSAWLNLARYDSNRPFLPWLFSIAVNKCRDFTRRRKVRSLFLLDYASRARLEMAQDNAALDRDGEHERLRQLDMAIAALPIFYKEPLLLTAIGGLSHRQAADTLKTTPKGIEMRVRRAREKLGDSMGRVERGIITLT